jgi:predicted MFS family arabinose efflux permease
MGVFSMCFASAVTLGSPLGGLVLERYGGNVLWAGCVGATLVAAGMFLAARRIKEMGET